MTALFTTIVADPPWNERGGGRIKRGADRHYPVMKTPEIIELLTANCPPLDFVNPDKSALFLWATNTYLLDAGEVMRALGYRYLTCLTWGKTRIGLGQYFRGQTEHVLFGVKGKWSPREDLNGWSPTLLGGDLLDRPGGHSHKPAELQDMIEERFPGEYLELFARRARSGWHAWGTMEHANG